MTTPVFQRLEEALDGVDPAGVVHVGAHRGQEVPDYRRFGFRRVVLVEPNPTLWPHLATLGVDVWRCAAGSAAEGVLNLTGWDERASLLHPLEDPLVGQVTVPVRPLSDMQDGCNVAVLDCQGSELDVLRTADLSHLDALIVECCDRPRYQGAALRSDIEGFLTGAGWWESGVYGGHSTPDLVDVVWQRKDGTACE